MNDLVKVGTKELPVIEWNGQRVITTAQLADIYEATEVQIKQNYGNNTGRFEEGEHFYLLKGEELRAFKNMVEKFDLVGKNAPQLYLWTRRGASRHCKMLGTDKAWEQFDVLEENYYNPQGQFDMSKLSPELQMFQKIFNSVAEQQLKQKRQAEQLNRIEQKQDAIVDTFQKTDDTEDFQKWANDRIAQIAESPKFDKGYGRSKNYSLARSESYERLKQKRNCRLDDRVQKAKGRALEERPDIKKSELDKINKIYIIANDKDLRPAYELVIKEMMMYYCVSDRKGGLK